MGIQKGKKLKALDRYILDSVKTLQYVKDSLEGANCLSSVVCDIIKFEDGIFYTFLPENVTKEQLYGFKWGGIKEDVREKIVDIIFSGLQNEDELICIFDDVDGTYRPSYDEKSFMHSGVHFEDQIYYLADKKIGSKEFLIDCFRTSNAYWHSLCVLSNIKFVRPNDLSITKSEMISFVKGAQMIFFGAYDGEGYIVWKKNGMKD